MKRDATRLPNRVKVSLHQRLKKVPVDDISAFLDILEAIDCPVGLSVAIKLRHGMFLDIVNMSIDAYDYNDPDSFADAYFCVKFLSKYPYFDTGIDRRSVAVTSFFEAEDACLRTNRRIRLNREGKGELPNPAVSAIISIAQRKISSILGEVDLDSISGRFGWGPGSNIGVRGKHTSAYNKFSGPLDVTRNCLIMGLCCINSTPSWAAAISSCDDYPSPPVTVLSSALKQVTGNEIIFVPKNAKTDRVIAVEPSMNSYIQKGIGSYIRKRLRERAGIDLNDQSVNQSLAQYGSRTDSLATVDLSMASDTISTELVRELLSDEWFELLSSCRSQQGTIKHTGQIVRFEKFSSMGNAYTFELESLIFYALSQAVVDQMGTFVDDTLLSRVSVFGDDIIIPSVCYKSLLEVLDYCGFSVNKSKSYDLGPFRESCGKDFFHGKNVRPLFIKERIDNVEAIYRYANSIRRYAHMRSSYTSCDVRFRQCWCNMVLRLPKPFRLFQPEGYGDQAIIGNFDESVPSVPRDGWDGYNVRVVQRRPVKVPFELERFGYTTVLQRAGSPIPTLGSYDIRDRTVPRISNLLVIGWYNLGPWGSFEP